MVGWNESGFPMRTDASLKNWTEWPIPARVARQTGKDLRQGSFAHRFNDPNGGRSSMKKEAKADAASRESTRPRLDVRPSFRDAWIPLPGPSVETRGKAKLAFKGPTDNAGSGGTVRYN